MTPIFLALLFCNLFISCHANENRIVGGVESENGRYPYQVALISPNGFQVCGGALILSDYVLTAAHCSGAASLVHIGRHNLEDGTEDYESIPIAYEIIHPDYCRLTYGNDLMLLRLTRSSIYRPVVMNSDNPGLSVGDDVTVMGWGTISEGGPGSYVLLEAEVDVVSNSVCAASYGQQMITTDMICAARPGKDACQGDSGGPLILKGSRPANDKLVGIVSWGFGCADPSFPGVYASVAANNYWIVSAVNQDLQATSLTKAVMYKFKQLIP